MLLFSGTDEEHSMYDDCKIKKVILTSLLLSKTPLSSVDRKKLSEELGFARNSSYVLQRQGKLPPPITPPIGPKFWHRFEVDAILLAMSDPEIRPEEMAASILSSRKQLPDLIRQAQSFQILSDRRGETNHKGHKV
jgi:hypothetical protein